MHMFDCWGRKEGGAGAEICKYTRIRDISNRLKNKNQRSIELTEFASTLYVN